MEKAKNNKIRKNVKCNYFIKRFTLEQIDKFTEMSVSEVNDRLLDGKGIITRDDAKVIEYSQDLLKLLRKINFPASLNKQFHTFLVEKQREYRSQLVSLLDLLSEGSRPVYYADLANAKYAEKLKSYNAIINHETIQSVFANYLCGVIIEVENASFYKSYYATIKDYKLRSKQLTGSRTHDKDLMYEEIGFHKAPIDTILEEAFNIVDYFYSMPDEEYEITPHSIYADEPYGEPALVRTNGATRIYEYCFIPFDTRYYIMTRHNIRNVNFRDNVEFIAYIPSITEGRTEDMVSQLETDIELIKNFMVEKEEEKGKDLRRVPNTYGVKLINLFEHQWMKGFSIPKL